MVWYGMVCMVWYGMVFIHTNDNSFPVGTELMGVTYALPLVVRWLDYRCINGRDVGGQDIWLDYRWIT